MELFDDLLTDLQMKPKKLWKTFGDYFLNEEIDVNIEILTRIHWCFVTHTWSLWPTEYSKENEELQQIDEDLKALSDKKIQLEKVQEEGSHLIGKMTPHKVCCLEKIFAKYIQTLEIDRCSRRPI